jgi:hypothetical protein
MQPIEMARECAKAMAEPGYRGVILTIPKWKMPPGFPRGEFLNEMPRASQVVCTYNFNPQLVLAWLVQGGLITMRRDGDRGLVIEAPSAFAEH